MRIEELGVLIAEDRPQARDILRSILRNIGFGVIVQATNGREAFDALVERNKAGRVQGLIHLVIADWMMPIMTGIDLLRAIRKDSDLKDLPFIMVTGENERAPVEEALELEVSDYIVKPYSASTFGAKVRKILKKMGCDSAAAR